MIEASENRHQWNRAAFYREIGADFLSNCFGAIIFINTHRIFIIQDVFESPFLDPIIKIRYGLIKMVALKQYEKVGTN